MVFPTPLATAITIRDMHQASAEGPTGRTTRRKMRILGWTFGLASALRVGSQFAVGILWVRLLSFIHLDWEIRLTEITGLASIYLVFVLGA